MSAPTARVGRPPLPEALIDSLRACAVEGLTKAQAAERVGIAFRRVKEISRSRKIVFKDGRTDRSLTPAVRAGMELCASQGKTVKQTSIELDITINRVCFLAKKLGLKFSKPVASKPRRKAPVTARVAPVERTPSQIHWAGLKAQHTW